MPQRASEEVSACVLGATRMVLMENGPTLQASDVARSLMRARPPQRTLRWLVGALDAGEVVDVEWMRGGSTSALHRVILRSSAGATRTVALRHYVLDEVVAEDPNIVAHA